jgi:hypothetical protein
MLNLFATVKVEDRSVKDVTQRIKSSHCWQLTIKNQDVNELLIIRRLNQEFVKKKFGTVRKLSGNCYNPTPIQFKRAFNKLFCMKYLQHNPQGNCGNDLASVLSAIGNMPHLA